MDAELLCEIRKRTAADVLGHEPVDVGGFEASLDHSLDRYAGAPSSHLLLATTEEVQQGRIRV